MVITGPPGAGKSTVAAILASAFDRSALVVGDQFFGFLTKGIIAPWLAEANRQNEIVIQAPAAAAGRLATGEYTVVYDRRPHCRSARTHRPSRSRSFKIASRTARSSMGVRTDKNPLLPPAPWLIVSNDLYRELNSPLTRCPDHLTAFMHCHCRPLAQNRRNNSCTVGNYRAHSRCPYRPDPNLPFPCA
jgi:predicted ATPase